MLWDYTSGEESGSTRALVIRTTAALHLPGLNGTANYPDTQKIFPLQFAKNLKSSQRFKEFNDQFTSAFQEAFRQ